MTVKVGIEPQQTPVNSQGVRRLCAARKWQIAEVIRCKGTLRVNVLTGRRRSPVLTFVVPH